MSQAFFEKLQQLLKPKPKAIIDTPTLKVTNIPKIMTYEELRKFFAKQGQIHCFNLSVKPEYETAIGYVIYKKKEHFEALLKKGSFMIGQDRVYVEINGLKENK
jgi:RNA recognition motif-containing protein